MMAKKNKKAHSLSKLMAYVLERKPDEFGLVPDAGGYFKIKDVLKAVCEEEGFRWVRRAHLNEVLLTIPDPGFEIDGNLIRPTGSAASALPKEAVDLPKLLFTCVRRRAYLHVIEKGITPTSHSQIVLSDDMALAERIGRRSDASPVVLTVQVAQACKHGVRFQAAGKNIYLADEIPPDCFRGPALPKEREKKPAEPEVPERKRSATPGSFALDIAAVEESSGKHGGKKGGKGYGRSRDKKNKPKRERPPWRR
jgi:putative RNA 2'-phosphotransferase